MSETELSLAFSEIKRIGAEIIPRTKWDSNLLACTTQFQFVYDTQGPEGVLKLCKKFEDNVVLAEHPAKKALVLLVFNVRAVLRRKV